MGPHLICRLSRSSSFSYILIIFSLFTGSPQVFAAECVILLHGLARSANAMKPLEKFLTRASFHVVNADYPSTEKPIEDLAGPAIDQSIEKCGIFGAKPINFVTHSMGGILVRQYYHHKNAEKVKRVVMLGPPNQGSEVVDRIKNFPGFNLINGPAGFQLGTDETSVPLRLGSVQFALGIIAGTRSVNWINSMMLPESDDGKVTVARTRVAGACSFLTLPVTHTFMMKNDEVMNEVLYFLTHGQFKNSAAENHQADTLYCHNPQY